MLNMQIILGFQCTLIKFELSIFWTERKVCKYRNFPAFSCLHFYSISQPSNSISATPFPCCTRFCPKGFPNQFDLPGVSVCVGVFGLCMCVACGRWWLKGGGEWRKGVVSGLLPFAINMQYCCPLSLAFWFRLLLSISTGGLLVSFFFFSFVLIPLVLTPRLFFFFCILVDFVCCRDFIAWFCFVCPSATPIPISMRPAKSLLTWHFNDVGRSGIPVVTGQINNVFRKPNVGSEFRVNQNECAENMQHIQI